MHGHMTGGEEEGSSISPPPPPPPTSPSLSSWGLLLRRVGRRLSNPSTPISWGLPRPSTVWGRLPSPTSASASASAPESTSTSAPASPSSAACSSLLPALLALTTLLTYGLSLFVNGIASSRLHINLYASLVVLGFTRGVCMFGLAALLFLLTARRRREGGGGADGAVPPLVRPFLKTVVATFVGNAGFAPFSILSAPLGAGGAGGGAPTSSLLSSLVPLYCVIPVLWGLVVRGEDRSPLKVLGITLTIISVAVLAASGGGGSGDGDAPSSPLSPSQILLFLAAISCWGGADIVSGYVGRALPLRHVALASGCGQVLTAAVFAFAGVVVAGGGAPPPSPPHLLLLMGANAAAIVGWVAFVRLGVVGEASSFVPVVSLYAYVSVILASVLLGEGVGVGRGVGMGVGVVGVLLTSVAWKGREGKGGEEDKAGAAQAVVGDEG
jgi:drug/metabolite transporter (DMT)-like permease